LARFWTKYRVVFLAWAIAELVGWSTTHFFFRSPTANWLWLVLSVLAFIPMVRHMRMSVPKLRNIMILWVVTVAIGLAISFLVFSVAWLVPIAPYLGPFWLLLMGVAFLINALWWPPRCLIVGGVLQIVAGLAVILIPSLLSIQYLVAAVAGTGGMLVLLPGR
jgi:hypothetical protein